MNRYLFPCLLLMMATVATAQKNHPAKNRQFHSLNMFGLLEGETGSSFQIQTINGVQYGSWYAGIGIGLDYYRFRTIPLFLDIRKEFLTGANKIFVYADAGISFSWITDAQKDYYQNSKYSNGFYNDFGLGYKMKVGKTNALLLSAGYSYKKLVETQTYYYNGVYLNYYNGIYPGLYGESPQKIQYAMNRISLKIGFEF